MMKLTNNIPEEQACDVGDSMDTTNTTIKDICEICDSIKSILMEKNRKYGDSAINPIRVFSKASNIEQILVRIDDKISRLRTQAIDEDEDVLTDLIGYFVLLKVAIKQNKEKQLSTTDPQAESITEKA